MCGICGFITKETKKIDILVEMSQVIAHRGLEEKCFLVRGWRGKNPLYYYVDEGIILFLDLK